MESAARLDQVPRGFLLIFQVKTWKSPRMETAQPLWVTCSSAWLSSPPSMGWSVVHCHILVTLSSFFSDPDPYSQSDCHPSWMFKLLLHVKSPPSLPIFPVFPEKLVSIHHSAPTIYELSHHICFSNSAAVTAWGALVPPVYSRLLHIHVYTFEVGTWSSFFTFLEVPLVSLTLYPLLSIHIHCCLT